MEDKKRFRGDEDLLNVSGILKEIGHAIGCRNLTDSFQLITLDQKIEPRRCSEADRDCVTLQILKPMNRRILMHHEGLRIVLHGRGHRHQGYSISYGLQHVIGRGHLELRRAYGDLLIGVDVRTSREDGYVQTLVFIVATKERVIKATMLWLGIPVGLQSHWREPARCWLLSAAPEHEAGAKGTNCYCP